jgi:hypothetical protein
LKFNLQVLTKPIAAIRVRMYEQIIRMDELATILKIVSSSSGGIAVRKLNSSKIRSSLPIKNLTLIAPNQTIANAIRNVSQYLADFGNKVKSNYLIEKIYSI